MIVLTQVQVQLQRPFLIPLTNIKLPFTTAMSWCLPAQWEYFSKLVQVQLGQVTFLLSSSLIH